MHFLSFYFEGNASNRSHLRRHSEWSWRGSNPRPNDDSIDLTVNSFYSSVLYLLYCEYMTDQSHILYGLENGQFSYTDLDDIRMIVKVFLYTLNDSKIHIIQSNLMSRLRRFSISRGQSYCRDLRLMISSSRQFPITDLKILYETC